jgi:hypothetical protein
VPVTLSPSDVPNRKIAIRNTPGSRPLHVASAPQFVHCLLFVQEFVAAHGDGAEPELSPISFFLQRSGGVHVMLLLLNIAYQKPSLGWARGWPFGVLSARVGISPRSLRQLLADGIAEGVIERRCGHIDKRRLVYCGTPALLRAWMLLYDRLAESLPEVFGSFSSNELVDIDYRVWDPSLPARDQTPPRAVSKYLKSAI